MGGISSNLWIVQSGAGGVCLTLSGGVTVAELSRGTCMAAGVGAVVPSKSFSLGTVFGGTGTIRHHIVVLGTGTLIAMPSRVHAVSSNAQITSGRTRQARISGWAFSALITHQLVSCLA